MLRTIWGFTHNDIKVSLVFSLSEMPSGNVPLFLESDE